ncbi:hypothetical protein [Nocardiopsis valliformis]|uniref:hypothetical protein n=1 Tax=Nocardiopsis valliformis TaxID=239974 RepID=UPI000346ABBE|nr:hypothetical protein [Nocardiopsis valliformis]
MLTRIVDDFGTGYVHTTVVHTVTDGFVWVRSSGIDRPLPIGALPDRIRPLLASIRGPVTFQPHQTVHTHETWRVFPAPGPSSVAKQLLLKEEGASAAAGVLRSTGAALAQLHSHLVPGPTVLPSPQGPARLSRWLDGSARHRASERLREEAVRFLGASRMRAARLWCAGLQDEEVRRSGVLLHGAPGLGVLIPSVEPGANGSSAGMLTGEELTTGPVESDLGWIAGELVEHREVATGDAQEEQRLIDALLTGYGPTADLDAVARFAVLRMFVHVHDFANYVGWHESVRTHLALLADALDSADSALLKQPLRPKDRQP